MSSVFDKPPGNIYILPDDVWLPELSKSSEAMKSALRGEASAIADIKEMGVEKVLFSYKYRLASRIRNIWFFRAYTDVVVGNYLALHSCRKTVDTRHVEG